MMRMSLDLDQLIPTDWMKAAYQTLQDSKAAFGLAHKTLNNRVTSFFVPEHHRQTESLAPEVMAKLQTLRTALLENDWQDGENGIYPPSLVFDNEWQDFLRYYPAVWFDMPSIWERLQEKQYQKFSSDIDLEGYPSYYLQNFHYQTDGYLGEMSANLYDLQVEILFNGSADAMRRRILKPLKIHLQSLEGVTERSLKVLDVACGTGRSLKMIRAALPKASLFGVDLSPTYLRKANQILSQSLDEMPQLIQANGEDLPYQDDYFHAVTSIFLFHELQPQARQNTINEAFRVLKPDGILILCDSIQAIDSPDFQSVMDNFSSIFHEPYYRHYITDNLVGRLEKAGFKIIHTETHLVSKYWIAIKPS